MMSLVFLHAQKGDPKIKHFACQGEFEFLIDAALFE